MKKRMSRNESRGVRLIGISLGFLGLAVVILGGYYSKRSLDEIILALYPNIGTDLLSLALTVVFIDWLYEIRDHKLYKSRLIRQMGDEVSALTLPAVRELRLQGWLADGSLVQADFCKANLRRANLRGADLRKTNLSQSNLTGAILNGADLQKADLSEAILNGAKLDRANLRYAFLRACKLEKASLEGCQLEKADLFRASLQGARLSHANLFRANLASINLRSTELDGANLREANLSEAILQGTDLSDQQLSTVATLRGAIMPDGHLYNGRFLLRGDLLAARRAHIDVNNHHAMARFYGVSMKDYFKRYEASKERKMLSG